MEKKMGSGVASQEKPKALEKTSKRKVEKNGKEKLLLWIRACDLGFSTCAPVPRITTGRAIIMEKMSRP